MEKQTTPHIKLPLLLALCTVLGMVVGMYLPKYDKHFAIYQNRPGAGQSLLSEVMGYVDSKYVDDIDSIGFDEAAVVALLEKLDPHTTYIAPGALEQVQAEMDGAFTGIGIEFLITNDTLQVISALSGGPAEAAGIWSGDKFITVNDTPIAGVKISESQLYNMLRGETGTTVRVGVLRGQEQTLRQITITRDEIPVHCVTSAYMLDDRTAYLKLSRFNQNTHQEFLDALIPMQQAVKGALHLVLDLRGNPGGLLNQAVQVLSDLFPEDKLLVYTQGRSDNKREYKSSGRSQVNIDRVAVLMDEGSASASEVIAGAIQDYDRGWVVGSRSFGKGLVQEQFPLSNGGALRLTVSRYYMPSGRCIQKDYVKHRDSYHTEHLLRGDSSVVDSSRLFYTGKGRVVLGNSGIIPDLVVTKSEMMRSALYGRVTAGAASFTASWLEGRDKSAFGNKEAEFIANYALEPEVLESYKSKLASEGIVLNAKQWAEFLPHIRTELKAALARNLFGSNAWQQVKNQDDTVVKAALKQIYLDL